MNMSRRNGRDDRDLIGGWLEGRLQDAELTRLQERLRESKELRETFLAECQLDAALREVAGQRQTFERPGEALARQHGPAEAEQSVAADLLFSRRAWGVTMGVVCLVAAILLLSPGGVFSLWQVATPDRRIATIESVQGVVAFRDGGGERFLAVDRRLEIGAGMLLLDGESAAVQVRFVDGSLMSLVGPAEASLEVNSGGRRIKLRSGSLTAEVRPQGRTSPLVIETPTAAVVVLGTVLSLTVGADRTQVQVDSGRVRLERLADGATVEIAPHQRCVATLDTGEALQPVSSRRESRNWKRTFAIAPPEQWKGEWIAGTPDRPGVMRSVPCVMGRTRQPPPNNAPVIHHGVSVRPTGAVDLGQVNASSRLQFTLSVSEPTNVQVLLGVLKSDGRFGGNFELLVDSEEGEELVNGFRHFDVPLSGFVSKMSRFPVPEDGDKPYLLLITTLTRNAGMELSEVGFVEQELAP